MTDKEKLIKSIMTEAERDNEPLTREEAEEVAEMELKAKVNSKHYERAEASKERKPRAKKVDEDKKSLLEILSNALAQNGITATAENETKLHFEHSGSQYTIMLTRHRASK